MNRRLFLALAASVAAAGAAAQPVAGPSEAYFSDWLAGFYRKALAAGLPSALVERELAGLTPDPRVTVLDARQPEFAKPVGDYIKSAISPARVAQGRARRSEIAAFPAIERQFGVPRDILLGVWAMESAFGALQGDMDVIRSLATLAQGRRRAWAEDQLIAALKMVAGGVPRTRLRGSWAGAMGQTQVEPGAFLQYAVSASGSGAPDVWGSPADALATAANLLAKSGWRRGEGWATEVVLPAGFDFGLSEGPKEGFAWWRAKGVRRSPTAAWAAADGQAPGMLLLPSGAAGPAFLALPNHFAIRSYNNSIAYALAVGLLADRFAGGAGLATPWPRETPLSLTERMTAQSALAKLGFSPGVADGMVGAGTRAALRAWQKKEGLPADGYLSPAMIARLTAAAGRS